MPGFEDLLLPLAGNTLDPFLQGVDPTGRRALVLLPRGAVKTVDFIIVVIIQKFVRDGDVICFFVNDGLIEGGIGKCVTYKVGSDHPHILPSSQVCAIIVDSVSGTLYSDLLPLAQRKYRGARVLDYTAT
ncbi:MAG: hypothetical protein AAB839_00250 [Patescibacteria group bacterium]